MEQLLMAFDMVLEVYLMMMMMMMKRKKLKRMKIYKNVFV
jgi:hypothetical protein